MTGALASVQYLNTPLTTAQLSNQNILKFAYGTATASYTIGSDGKVKNQSGSILEAWMLVAPNSNYEVMVAVTSGDLTSGTTGTWLACSSDHIWSVTNDSLDNSTITAVISVQIRNATSHTVLASASITLSAESRSHI